MAKSWDCPIGENDIPFFADKILQLFKSGENGGAIAGQLGSLAIGVLGKKEGSKINRDLESNKINEKQALCQILLEWKIIKGKDATVKNFYDSIPCSEDDSDKEEVQNVASPPARTFQKVPGSTRISSEDEPASNSFSITIEALIPVFAGPSGRMRTETARRFKRKRMSSPEEWKQDGNYESSDDEPSPKENESRFVRRRKVVSGVASVSPEVWAVKLKSLEMNKDALRLLNLMAYLKHDVVLKTLLIKLGALSKMNEGQVDTAVEFLLKHGMILKKKTVGEVFCILPDLQKQMRVAKKGEEKVLEELLKYFAGLQQWNVKGRCEDEEYSEDVLDENVEHVLTVWTYAVNYPKLIRAYSKLLCDVLGLLESEGERKKNQQKGIQLGLVALEIFKIALGVDHVDCFKLEKNIAVLMYLVGNCEESAKKLKELARNLVHILEENDENENLLLEIKAEQAEALTLLEKHEEAQKLQREVLTKMKMNRGETATSN